MHADVPKNRNSDEILNSETQSKSQAQQNKTSPTNEQSLNSVSPDHRNIHKGDTKPLEFNIGNNKFKNDPNNCNGQYTCHICKKTLGSYASLHRHEESVHTGVKYKCEFCKKLYSDRSSLKRHYNRFHKNIRSCDVCKKECRSQKALRDHYNKHNGIRFPCDVCKADYSCPANLLRHKKKCFS